jgi:flagellar biosynthesis/type III secretory pathway protein FliH
MPSKFPKGALCTPEERCGKSSCPVCEAIKRNAIDEAYRRGFQEGWNEGRRQGIELAVGESSSTPSIHEKT